MCHHYGPKWGHFRLSLSPKAGKGLELRADGIVVRSAGGGPTRVALWQDVVGAVGYDDGYRSLHLASGLSFAVRPVEWFEDVRLTPAVDAHLAGKLAHQGPRPEGALDAVERAVLQLRDATAGVSQARAERDRARRSFLKTFPLAVAAVSVVLLVLGAAVYALLKLTGVVPASAALLGVATLLLVGWRVSRNADKARGGPGT